MRDPRTVHNLDQRRRAVDLAASTMGADPVVNDKLEIPPGP